MKQKKGGGWYRLAVLLVIFIAAASRFWQLDTLPPGLHPAEAVFGLHGLSLMGEGGMMPEGPLSVWLLGRVFDLYAPTPWHLRALGAGGGVVLVLGVYAAAAALFKPAARLIPLLAMLAVITLYPALNLSRWGSGLLWSVALFTLAMALFWHSLNLAILLPPRRRSVIGRHWLWLSPEHPYTPGAAIGLAGVLLGFSWAICPLALLPSLLFPLFLGGWYLVDKLVVWQHRRLWLFLGLPLLCIGGLTFWLANEGLGGWLIFRPAQVGRLLIWLFASGSEMLAYNLPGRSFLDLLQAGLLLVGLITLARQWSDRRGRFLALWFGVSLLPALFTSDFVAWPMLLFAAAPLSLLMALGLVRLGQQLQARWPRAELILCVPLLISLFLTGRAYFITYANHPDLAAAFAVDEWLMARHAAAYPPETWLYLTPPKPEAEPTIQFALRHTGRLRAFTGEAGVWPLGRLQAPALYLIGNDQPEAVTYLTQFFPTATLSDEPLDSYQTVYVPPFLPRLPQNRPTDLSLGDGIGLVDWQVVEEEGEMVVTLYWQAAATPQQDYTFSMRRLDEQDNILVQTDNPLIAYPTGRWQAGEIVQITARLPQLAPTIPNRLVVGFYQSGLNQPLAEVILVRWP